MTKFSNEFRLKLALEVEVGQPLNAVARKCNVGENTLCTGVYNYRTGGTEQLVAVREKYT